MTELAGLTQMDVLTELVRASEDDALHCLTLDDLAERIQHPKRVIVKRMQALMQNKYAKTVRIGCYAVTPKGLERHLKGGEIKSGLEPGSKFTFRAANTKSLRARLWKALRTLEKCTISEMLELAAKPDEVEKGRDSAHRLMSQLTRAGFVKKMARRSNPLRDCSNGEVIYFLLRKSGPLPPMETTDKASGERGLKDRNDKAFYAYEVHQPRPAAVGRIS